MPGDITWWRPEFGEEEERAVAAVVRGGFVNDGKTTREFEAAVAALVGSRHAVAVTSGSAAIYLALKAQGVGPGDEVVVPDITFVATANAVVLCGAVPVLADVDPLTLTLDPASAERALTPRTKALVPVHVSGRGGTIHEIVALARRRGLAVIEDAAEALGSRCSGAALGTLGRFGCFSFSPNKTVTTGQGGMVVTDDAAGAELLRILKDQGRTGPGTGGDDEHPHWGFNFKLTSVQAGLGLAQLARLGRRLERQRRINALYREGLAGVRQVRVLPFDLEGGEVPQWTDVEAEDRDGLEAFLRGRGALCRKFWFPVHRQKPYLADDRGFPNSSRVAPRCLWLPSAFQLEDADVARISSMVAEYYSR